MGELIVNDQGKFHNVDNDLNFNNTWELTHLLKSIESHLDQSVDFFVAWAFEAAQYLPMIKKCANITKK